MFLTRKRNKRSNVNLSKVAPTTLAPGNIVPISTTRVYTGDVAKFSPSAFVQAFPMKQPLVNGFKVCLEYFFIPDRLYNSDLSLNFSGVTDNPDNVKFPTVDTNYENRAVYVGTSAPSDFYLDVSAVGSTIGATSTGSAMSFKELAAITPTPGSLADYFGVPLGFIPMKFDRLGSAEDPEANPLRYLNAIPMIGYLDIIYNYYINQQIEDIPTAYFPQFILDDEEVVDNTVISRQRPQNQSISYQITRLERFLRGIKTAQDPDAFMRSWEASTDQEDGYPNNPAAISDSDSALESASRLKLGTWTWLCSRASIFQRCMPPYYLESWMSTSGYNNASVNVDVNAEEYTGDVEGPTDGYKYSISLRTLATQSHIQRWLDLAMSGGSRYSDYLNAEFDTSRVRNSNVPIYLGSDRQYLGSKVIYQTTGFNNDDSPLGSFAGQASGGEQFKRRTFKFGENGYFMVLASLVPDVIYQRGLSPWLEERTLGDVYVPALDNIASEALQTRTLDAVSADDLTTASGITHDSVSGITYDQFRFILRPDQIYNEELGFVPAWSKVSHDYSRTHGRLNTTLSSWILGRSYGSTIDANIRNKWANALENYVSDVGNRTFYDTETGAGEDEYVMPQLSNEEYLSLAALVNFIRRNNDYSPYVDASAYNNSFADTANYAQNFVMTFNMSFIVNREKSKVNTPNII